MSGQSDPLPRRSSSWEVCPTDSTFPGAWPGALLNADTEHKMGLASSKPQAQKPALT